MTLYFSSHYYIHHLIYQVQLLGKTRVTPISQMKQRLLTFGFGENLLTERSPKVLAPVGLFFGCGNLRKDLQTHK